MQVRRTASEDVYDKVKSDILSLSRVPGAEIKINEIAEEMGISRSPVRDALMKLSDEGLVDMLPQRGCWVSLINLERVDEERFLRHSLEKSVLSYFMEYAKASDISKLQYFVSLQKEALKDGDEGLFFTYDDQMHESIFHSAGKGRIWQIIARETGHYRRMRILSFDQPGVLDKNIEQHIELIEALKEKDIAAALRIEGEHVFKLTFEAGEIIHDNPSYFKKGSDEIK